MRNSVEQPIPAWQRVVVYDDRDPESAVRAAASGPSPDPERESAWQGATRLLRTLEDRYGWKGYDGKGGVLAVYTQWGAGMEGSGGKPIQNAVGDENGVWMGTIQAAAGPVVLAEWPQYLQHEIVHAINESTLPPGRLPNLASIKEGWADFLPAAVNDTDWRIYDDRQIPVEVAYDLSAPTRYPDGTPITNAGQFRGTAYVEMHQPGKLTSLAGTRVADKIGREAAAEVWFRAMTEHFAREFGPFAGDKEAIERTNRIDPNGTWAFEPAARATLSAAADMFGASSQKVQAVRDAWRSVGVSPSWAHRAEQATDTAKPRVSRASDTADRD